MRVLVGFVLLGLGLDGNWLEEQDEDHQKHQDLGQHQLATAASFLHFQRIVNSAVRRGKKGKGLDDFWNILRTFLNLILIFNVA